MSVQAPSRARFAVPAQHSGRLALVLVCAIAVAEAPQLRAEAAEYALVVMGGVFGGVFGGVAVWMSWHQSRRA